MNISNGSGTLRVGLAQIEPVWLHRDATLVKVLAATSEAAEKGCGLVVFGEGVLPGYPFWLAHTDGAKFESQVQKAMHAHYVANAVSLEAGHLDQLRVLAKKLGIAVYLGCIEQPLDRGASLYASLVYIDAEGCVGSVHRKLMPTYEERLTWSPGDGHGLRTHPLHGFRVGGLNCWENWMPMARAALYGQGETLHVAVWPGSPQNTEDITRFMAKEGRSFVVSVSGLMHKANLVGDLPGMEQLRANLPDTCASGGSCVAGPDGTWVLPPQGDQEGVFVADLDLGKVHEERQNFDPAGHYSRPDVLSLRVDFTRQKTVVEQPPKGE